VGGVMAGVLSGDGTCAVVLTSAGASSWSPGETGLTSLGPATAPLAVDWDGQRALLATRSGRDVLVATRLPTKDETTRADAGSGGKGRPDWPPEAAPLLAWGPDPSSEAPSPLPETPHALATVRGGLPAAATPGAGGGVIVQRLPFPPVTRIASGAEPVTALAADPTQSRLAVAVGGEVGVWTIDRGTAAVPGYDSDRAAGDDLLDADRDAQALAGLIASAELIPPLAVGLFGAWGSGKSFVLNRIEAFLEQLTGPAAPDGYLRYVKVVPFNAWHYAETNLWASLVDEVLVKIGPAAEVPPPTEVSQAQKDAADAESAAEGLAGEVAKSEQNLRRALRAQAQRRRRTWLLAVAAAAVVAGAVAVAVFYGPGRLVAGWTAAITLLATVAAGLAEARKIRSQAAEVIQAGRQARDESAEAVGRLAGAPEAEAVRNAGHDLRERQHELELARQEASRLRARADELGELASSPSLGPVLSRLASVSEYRDQLSLVTRTRERFAAIDKAIAEARQAPVSPANQRRTPPRDETATERQATDRQASAPDQTQLERVVVIIDDLDRCPPEKVVEVLEAVHLLFDFAMFVVVIAVDTRWLAQSLRIRYRRLLGSTKTAAPSDYLEKIIQIPLNLLPLGETQTQAMIAGLAGHSKRPPTAPITGRADARGDRPDVDQTESDQVKPGGGAGARRARTPRRSPSGLPAEVLRITPPEAEAMSEVAALVGTTPRTVKRFVNTYRLLKARSDGPEEFDSSGEDKLGDHQVVAFLLALVTGQAELARRLLRAVQRATPGHTLQDVINGLDAPATATAAGPPTGLATAPDTVTTWLGCHKDYAQARAARYANWAAVVARFSFSS
jgi:KAP-like P-loop domain-containing protein